MEVARLLDARPHPIDLDREVLAACIEECVSCAQVCVACADADLAEDDIAELARCIGLCLVCDDVCTTTANTMTRQTVLDLTLARRLLETCIEACGLCGDECERHAHHHEHCRICAESCRRCARVCEEMLSSLPGA